MRRLILLPLVLMAISGCKSREERLQAVEEQTKGLADAKARAAKGIGESLKTEGKAGAESLSQGVGEVLKGVGRGFESSLGEVKVQADPSLAAKGIQVTRATASGYTIAVYTILEKGFSGTLTLRALDAQQMEVGRRQVVVKEPAGTAKYIEFPFDKHTPMSSVAIFEMR